MTIAAALSLRDALALPWEWEPGIVVPVLLSGALYALGTRRMRRSGATFVAPWARAAFWVGWCTIILALLSPLHPLSEELFWTHMVQHELLMTVAAPLLVVGRPLLVCLRGLPASWQPPVTRAWGTRSLRRSWSVLTRPVDAWLLHGAVIWIWHAPLLFDAALQSDAVHALQHAAFLGTALLFWESLLYARSQAATAGIGIVALFTTAVHTGALGALMTFARTPWYPTYADRALQWGFTPLQDQQLAGLIMWIPGSLAYLIVALVLAARWLRDSENAGDASVMGAMVQP